MTKRVLKGLTIASLLVGMLAAAPAAEGQRNRRAKCAQHIRQAEIQLQRAIQRYGPRSRQAAKKRRQLENARERCGAL